MEKIVENIKAGNDAGIEKSLRYSNVGLDDMTHFWCEVCGKIQPTFFEGALNQDVSATFSGGDIVCEKCDYIIATAYVPNV